MNAKKISPADIIFADIILRGREFLSMRLTGASCLGDVIRAMRDAAGRALGTVVLKIRNFSQGWSMRQMMVVA